VPRVVDFKISGLSELQDKLDHAPLKASRTILRRSLKEAGRIWLDEMKARVRQGPHRFKDHSVEFGVIEKNIKMRTSVKDDLSGKVSVGINESKSDPKSPFWAIFLEFGTGQRSRGHKSHRKQFANVGGASTGQMPRLPFARPTFESKKDEVVDEFVEDVKKALREEGLIP
jgi:HK97 gp10 family phage protein